MENLDKIINVIKNLTIIGTCAILVDWLYFTYEVMGVML